MKIAVRVLMVVVGLTLCGLSVLAQAKGAGKRAPGAPERIRSTMERYVKLLSAGDTDGIMSLYGDDPSVEDPVGATPRTGREAVRAFYAAVGKLNVELDGRVRVAGREGAMPMVAEIALAGRKGFIDVIDTMTFDDQGRIVSMRAYWNPGEIRPTR